MRRRQRVSRSRRWLATRLAAGGLVAAITRHTTPSTAQSSASTAVYLPDPTAPALDLTAARRQGVRVVASPTALIAAASGTTAGAILLDSAMFDALPAAWRLRHPARSIMMPDQPEYSPAVVPPIVTSPRSTVFSGRAARKTSTPARMVATPPMPASPARATARNVHLWICATAWAKRAKNAHRPTQERERQLRRGKSPGHVQRLLATYSPVTAHFRPRRQH